jgi:hypothetical protein
LEQIGLGAGLPVFLAQDTITGKNVPNKHKMYKMVIKHPKCPKIFQMAMDYINIFKSIPNLPQIRILGLKINHLATLPRCVCFSSNESCPLSSALKTINHLEVVRGLSLELLFNERKKKTDLPKRKK